MEKNSFVKIRAYSTLDECMYCNNTVTVQTILEYLFRYYVSFNKLYKKISLLLWITKPNHYWESFACIKHINIQLPYVLKAVSVDELKYCFEQWYNYWNKVLSLQNNCLKEDRIAFLMVYILMCLLKTFWQCFPSTACLCNTVWWIYVGMNMFIWLFCRSDQSYSLSLILIWILNLYINNRNH